MKRFFLICLILIALALPARAEVSKLGAICLTGGGTGCLDSYNGSTLSDLDVAEVVFGGLFRIYQLDADSGLPEDSPNVIKPDAAAGLKRWILINTTVVLAHAASHTDGTDDIQDATAGQKGLMTSTYATKLDGIEALADVTDTGNVVPALIDQTIAIDGINSDSNFITNVTGGNSHFWQLSGVNKLSLTSTAFNVVPLLSAEANIRVQVSGYLNYGAPVGSGGYGFRDNAGSIEFKDSGGSWAGFDISDIFVEPGTNTLSAAAAAASDGDVLRLKEGTYVQTEQILITSKSLSILGSGPEISIIRCTGTNGIVVDTNDFDKQVTLRDFTLYTTNSGTYTGISLESLDIAFGPVYKQFKLDNITIRGVTVGTDYWLKGITLVEAYHTHMSNLQIIGKTGQAGLYGIHLISGRNVPVKISDSNIYSVQYGVYVGGEAEGVYLHAVDIVAADYGVYWSTTAALPELNIIGCHINAFLVGIYGTNLHQAEIVGNLIYKRSDGTDNFVAIRLLNGSYHTIVGNSIFIHNEAGGNNGIVLSDSTWNTISGNVIQRCDTDIWLQAGANDNNVSGNIGDGTANHVLDQGSSNIIDAKLGTGKVYNVPSGTYFWQAGGGTRMSLTSTALNVVPILSAEANVHIQTSGYLNFGATDGSGGYGLRDNAGSIEFKDSGGSWGGAPAHTHDGDTLQLDGINSDGGAFSFSTTGTVAFVEDVTVDARLSVSTNDAPPGTFAMFVKSNDGIVIQAESATYPAGNFKPVLELKNMVAAGEGDGAGGQIKYTSLNDNGERLTACFINAGLLEDTDGNEGTSLEFGLYRNGVEELIIFGGDNDKDAIFATGAWNLGRSTHRWLTVHALSYQGSGDNNAANFRFRDGTDFNQYWDSANNRIYFYDTAFGYRGYVALTAGSPP